MSERFIVEKDEYLNRSYVARLDGELLTNYRGIRRFKSEDSARHAAEAALKEKLHCEFEERLQTLLRDANAKLDELLKSGGSNG